MHFIAGTGPIRTANSNERKRTQVETGCQKEQILVFSMENSLWRVTWTQNGAMRRTRLWSSNWLTLWRCCRCPCRCCGILFLLLGEGSEHALVTPKTPTINWNHHLQLASSFCFYFDNSFQAVWWFHIFRSSLSLISIRRKHSNNVFPKIVTPISWTNLFIRQIIEWASYKATLVGPLCELTLLQIEGSLGKSGKPRDHLDRVFIG